MTCINPPPPFMICATRFEAHDQERMAYVRNRMKQKLDEFMNGDQVDANRFEQEVIYYLDRLDINEEKVRLQQHCTLFYGNPQRGYGDEIQATQFHFPGIGT